MDVEWLKRQRRLLKEEPLDYVVSALIILVLIAGGLYLGGYFGERGRQAASSQSNGTIPGPRILTSNQLQRMIDSLRVGTGSTVRILDTGHDPEPHIFANQIREAFTRAGWKLQGGSVQILVACIDGRVVSRVVNTRATASDLRSARVKIIKSAFVESKVELPISLGCSNEDEFVTIFIGPQE
ncbi:MAG: hypothetical protein AB1515_01760 [Nitrospirota bacterium]